MVGTLLLQSFVAVHLAEQVPHVVYEALAVGEAAQEEGLAAMRALGLALLDPGAEAVVAGEFAAGGTHPWLFYVLKADVALQEGEVLPQLVYALHQSYYITNGPFQIILEDYTQRR
jgi:hypothetical protein